ncbi:sugar phosphate isomerase/epimerase [Acuticoccus sp. M5D2P5]|uniref:sugar phosphate isomerase/epimerase family protein n=1 Tax=Acuticoccus kalidii TaxID=2910977 RepID=UPI001F3E8305|nr:sugar phosphate isomerase/epimerase family protein [Acuticoccus kalidii]MCF3936126.1 sugar phosphate isomerase/epimerase [Acuticoccus kalidii]
MRLALCNEVICELDFADQCSFAAAVGYDGLEIAPFTLSETPHLLDVAQRRAIRRQVEDAGIKITSLHWLLVAPEGLSITSPDPEIRAHTISVMQDLCYLAADLDGPVLVHGSPHQRMIQAGLESDQTSWTLEAFAAAARAAEDAGVTYCVEPLAERETNNINTFAEAITLIEEIGSPNLRTMLDTSAAGITEVEPIEALIAEHVPNGRIAHCQFNDPNRRGPGEGEMKFAPILAALKNAGYRGDIAVEPFVYAPNGQACAARALGYLRGLMEAAA